MRKRLLAALVALLVTLGCGSIKRWSYEGFGRALRNTVRVEPAGDRPVEVRPLG